MSRSGPLYNLQGSIKQRPANNGTIARKEAMVSITQIKYKAALPAVPFQGVCRSYVQTITLSIGLLVPTLLQLLITREL